LVPLLAERFSYHQQPFVTPCITPEQQTNHNDLPELNIVPAAGLDALHVLKVVNMFDVGVRMPNWLSEDACFLIAAEPV
jgi:hypothetical protein